MPPRKKAQEEPEPEEVEGDEPEPEDEDDAEGEADEEEIEDQVSDRFGSNIDINITDERIDLSVPRDGDPEKILKAVGQLVKGLD